MPLRRRPNRDTAAAFTVTAAERLQLPAAQSLTTLPVYRVAESAAVRRLAIVQSAATPPAEATITGLGKVAVFTAAAQSAIAPSAAIRHGATTSRGPAWAAGYMPAGQLRIPSSATIRPRRVTTSMAGRVHRVTMSVVITVEAIWPAPAIS